MGKPINHYRETETDVRIQVRAYLRLNGCTSDSLQTWYSPHLSFTFERFWLCFMWVVKYFFLSPRSQIRARETNTQFKFNHRPIFLSLTRPQSSLLRHPITPRAPPRSRFSSSIRARLRYIKRDDWGRVSFLCCYLSGFVKRDHVTRRLK